MNDPLVPEIYKSPEKITEIIDDLSARRDGVLFHFAIDPADVVDFCFPVNPSESKIPEMRVVAEDQAALYDVLYAGQPVPVLLPEYIEEMRNCQSFLSGSLSTLHDKAAVLHEMSREIVLEKYDPSQASDLISAIKENFHLILALVMGVFSFGVDRFQTVHGRLVTLSQMGHPFDQLSESYKESPARGRIAAMLMDLLKKQEEQGLISREKGQRRRRSAQLDATAVDRLIHLNNSLQKGYESGQIPNRNVILYLSSAARTQTIFTYLRDQLPQFWGTTYPFWRTRGQLFASIVHRATKADGTEDVEGTLRNLREFRNAASKIKILNDLLPLSGSHPCNSCPRLGGSASELCMRREFCIAVNDLDKSIRLRQREIGNLGLAVGVRRYEVLLRVKPRGSEEDYLKIFRKIFHSALIRDLALAKFHMLQSFSVTQAESTSILAHGLARQVMRPVPGDITGSMNRLPVSPRIPLREYGEILDRVLAYYKTPVSELRSKVHLISEAYSLFVAKDATMNEPVGEHEVVRGMLYLAFPFAEAETRAMEHLKKSKRIFRALEAEYNYLIIWTARLCRDFEYGERLAQESIQRFPKDARPHHGRALNIISWLSDAELRSTCTFRLIDAVNEMRIASKLYDNEGKDSSELVGACLNDLAYLYTFDQNDQDSYNVHEARQALNELKRRVDKGIWDPQFPEYLHTEANVEYHEFLKAAFGEESNEQKRLKLQYAKLDIDAAVRIYPKSLHVNLRDKIDNALERMK